MTERADVVIPRIRERRLSADPLHTAHSSSAASVGADVRSRGQDHYTPGLTSSLARRVTSPGTVGRSCPSAAASHVVTGQVDADHIDAGLPGKFPGLHPAANS